LNCYGGSSGTGTGLWAARNASNCYGESGNGGTGLFTTVANTCTGYSPLGMAIRAHIGIGCNALDGTTSIDHKYNMP